MLLVNESFIREQKLILFFTLCLVIATTDQQICSTFSANMDDENNTLDDIKVGEQATDGKKNR